GAVLARPRSCKRAASEAKVPLACVLIRSSDESSSVGRSARVCGGELGARARALAQSCEMGAPATSTGAPHHVVTSWAAAAGLACSAATASAVPSAFPPLGPPPSPLRLP